MTTKHSVTAKVKAYSYVRFSSVGQAEGDSQRRQVELARLWCQRNGVQLVQQYSDLGLSAYHGANAATGNLARFLQLVKAKRIPAGSYLLIESIDRLSRDAVLEALELFTGIIRAGIVIVTLSDGHTYDKAKINDGGFSDLLISISIMARGNEESRIKSDRVGAAWEQKRARAGQEKLTALCPSWMKLADDRQHFELIPGKVETVRHIFKMAAQGIGLMTIARTLTKDGVPTPRGGKWWSQSYLSKLLVSRSVLGEYQPHLRRHGEVKPLPVIPNYYPKIISPTLFATAAQFRTTRPELKGRRSLRNPFAKMLFTPTGDRVVYLRKSPLDAKRHNEYLVAAPALVGREPYCTWRLDEFTDIFLWLTKKASLAKPPEAEQDDGRLAEARMQLRETEAGIRRLLDVLIRVKSADAEAKLRELDGKKLALQQRVSELETEAQAKPTRMDQVDWENPDELRSNLLRTVRRIVVVPARKTFEVWFLDGRHYGFDGHDPLNITFTGPKAEMVQMAQQFKTAMVASWNTRAAKMQAKAKKSKAKPTK
jgi:DNA invertase Pin-like site-specific DNA recombinase